MASLWKSIQELKLFGNRKHRKGDRSSRRRLWVEPLEPRQVLSFASITGVVLDDQARPIPGATVELRYEGVDGVFATSDDVTRYDTTDMGGGYDFTSLDAGSYEVQLPDNANNQSLFSGLLPPPGTVVQSVLVTEHHVAGRGATDIDEFTTIQIATDIETTGSPVVTIESDTRSAPEAIGGERDLFVDWTGGGSGEVSLKVNPFGKDVLQFDTSASARGDRVIVWDGQDGDPYTVDYTGLNTDLTEGGDLTGLQLLVWADHGGGEVEIRIYSDESNFSVATALIPETTSGDGSDVSPVDLLFAPDGSGRDIFLPVGGAGADFTNVGAIALEIFDTAGTVSVDGQMEYLGTLLGPQIVDFTHTAAMPKISLEKMTNGADADDPFGPDLPQIAVGESVTWTYEVNNTGNVPLANVSIHDDHGTPMDPADDFMPAMVGGDDNGDGLLDMTETWVFSMSGTAQELTDAGVVTVDGHDAQDPRPVFENVAVVMGTGGGQTVSDLDLSHYGNLADPAIRVVKTTNGYDVETAFDADVPVLAPGEAVTWLYVVTNEGNVPLANVTVLDDNGTPQSTADDVDATYVGGDVNNDGRLDMTESWTFMASGQALNLHADGVVTVDGNDPADPSPTYENFAVAQGTGGGIPVMDEDPSYYRNPPLASLGDYVWFDSDANGMQDPGEVGINGVTVHLLRDVSVVDSTTTSMDPDTGENGFYLFEDLNAGTYQVQFDVSTAPSAPFLPWEYTEPQQGDSMSDSDAIPDPSNSSLGTSEAIVLQLGENNRSVDAGLVSNPVPLDSSLGNFVWFDDNRNGIQDSGEAGVPGVGVELLNASQTVIDTTTTDANGLYIFNIFPPAVPGSFYVRFSNLPSRYFVTERNQGTDDLLDSDVDPDTLTTDLLTLADGTSDLSVDMGIVQRRTKFNFVVR